MKKKIKIASKCLLLLIFIFGVFSSSSWAAKSDVSYADEKQLTLNAENITIQQAIQNIQDQSEFDFFYKNVDLEKTQKRVSFAFKGKTIHEVLPELLEGTNLAYKVMEKDIVIFPSSSETVKENETSAKEARQQEIEITGSVTDAQTGDPLPGVNIVVEGTSTGATTDMDGNYSIEAPADATLVFSFVGYQQENIAVEGRENIDVGLQQEVTELEEVVAIGYRQRERGEVTGSVGQATALDIEQSGTPNIQKSLQGKVPGLVVSDRGGAPGQVDMEMFVRGRSTLNNNDPLIVINGVPSDMEDFAHMTPNDIESVNVLKDASAAIYGARAANGVILVQTKEGQEGEAQFSLQSEYGLQQPTEIIDALSSYERAVYNREASQYEGVDPWYSQEAIEHFKKQDMPLVYPNTNWLDYTLGEWAPQTHHNLSVRGGKENVQYFISGDYLYQEGMLKSGDLTYNQYQLRADINTQPTENLEIGVNLSGRIEQNRAPQSDSPFEDYIGTYKWIVAKWPDGRLGPPTESMQSPYTETRREYGFEDENEMFFNGKIDISYDMAWLTDGLELNGTANYTRNHADERTFYNVWTMWSRNPETGEYTPNRAFSRSHRGSRGVYSVMDLNKKDFYNIRLNYDRSFGEHNVSGFAAYEQSESYYQELGAYRKGLPSDRKPYLWAGQEAERDNWENIFEGGRVNYFGSLSYNYARKYMIDFTMRYDGSFNFAEEERFGLFPAVSAGYAISEEPFMSGINWLDNLKLRASYGKMGNDAVPNYQYLAQYDYYNAFAFGIEPTMHKGFSLQTMPNPGITWEVSTQQNIGFDATIFDGLFNVTMDLFKEKRRQILLSRAAAVPNYTALELPDENFGKVDNQGFEFTLNHENTVGEFNYNIKGDFTYNHNEIVEMAEPEETPEWRQQEGHPMGSFVVYASDGIYNTQEEIDNSSAHLDDAIPGDINYTDVDGDGEITGNDQIRKYSSITPEIQFGLNGNIEYKRLALNIFFQGQTNATTEFYFGDNHCIQPVYDQRWTPENKDATWPRAFLRDDDHNRRPSEFWLRDATFVRLKNVTLSYTLPSKMTSSVGISSLRVYLRGRNLKTWDKMIGNYDPEKENGLSPYPQIMRFMLGANINF